ncbi:hypothetical protein MAJJADAN_00012 [Pseudomonas phage Amjad_SA]|nr:hypothetical protein MAJJADAN_00012 [Pseudomonas phage Amjad_SA]
MKLQEAIRHVYGHRFGNIPPDGVFRRFRIDQFRVGFVVSVGDCALFGCRADGIVYGWNPAEVFKMNLPPFDSAKIRFERVVVECAKALIARGDALSAEDAERLELAVQRLDE